MNWHIGNLSYSQVFLDHKHVTYLTNSSVHMFLDNYPCFEPFFSIGNSQIWNNWRLITNTIYQVILLSHGYSPKLRLWNQLASVSLRVFQDVFCNQEYYLNYVQSGLSCQTSVLPQWLWPRPFSDGICVFCYLVQVYIRPVYCPCPVIEALQKTCTELASHADLHISTTDNIFHNYMTVKHHTID